MELKDRVLGSVIGFLFILISLSPGTAKAQYDDVSLETFYQELSPYGVWIQDPEYGTVWRPDVDQDDFRPYYTNGRWQMTKYGNTWVSDYEWGWAPFHYGRWHHSGRRGWVWVPDVHWGPAWVSWRSGGGHYGWAPLGPGINVNISIGRIPDFWWVFIPQRAIYYDRYPRYDHRRYRTIYQNTVIINNTYVYNTNRYYTGPRADDIRRVTRQPVRVHEVRDNRPSYAGNSPRPERSSVSNTNRGSVNGNSSSVTSRERTGAVTTPTSRPSTVANGRSSTSSGSVSSSGNRPSSVSSSRDGSSVSRTERSASNGTMSSPSNRPTTVASGRSSTGSTSTTRQTSPQGSPSQNSSTAQRDTRSVERTQSSRPSAPAPAPRQSTSSPSRTSSSSPQRQSPPPSSSRQETRSAPSSGRSSSGSSSAPSSRSADRSSSSRPSRGN